MRGVISLIFAAVLLSVSVQADAGGGHRRHHRSHVGVFIGAPLLFAPWWVSRPYYYQPAPVIVRERVIVREPLVFYDEQGNPVPPDRPQAQARTQPQESPAAVWYYCRDTQTYYPYVQTCASEWQRVTPQPPPPQQ